MRAALLLPEGALWHSIAVPIINITGAFILGVIVGFSTRFASSKRAERYRLLLGAGAMGGFTTYSSFAVQSVAPETIWMTLATVIVGTLAAWVGLIVGRPRIHKTVDASDRTPS